MSLNDFLAKCGIYFRPDFLDGATCEALRRIMAASYASPAGLYRDSSTNAIDLEARRTLTVDPPSGEVASIERELDDVRCDLERYFRVELTARELTDYLVYGPGAFFRTHRDRPNATLQNGADVQREVSVVVFLSQPPASANADYEGGDLRFFRLLDGPDWQDIGFACEATPGLLVAFRADTLHEVAPVTAGRRCTLVTWFKGRPRP